MIDKIGYKIVTFSIDSVSEWLDFLYFNEKKKQKMTEKGIF